MRLGKKSLQSTSTILRATSVQPGLSVATHSNQSGAFFSRFTSNQVSQPAFYINQQREFSLQYRGGDKLNKLLSRKEEKSVNEVPQLTRSQDIESQKPFKEQQLKVTDKTPVEQILIPRCNISPGYQSFHTRYTQLMNQMAIICMTSPLCAGIWIHFTDQWISSYGIAIMAIGLGTATERYVQARRATTYTHLSALINNVPLSISEKDNLKINAIMAGINPQIAWTYSGLKISGPSANMQHSSDARKEAIARCEAINRIVLPPCALSKKGAHLADRAFYQWLERFNLPRAIVDLAALLIKDPKDKRPEDYVAIAAAANKISDYVTGVSLSAAKYKFRKALRQCESYDDLMTLLVDHQLIHAGGMSFFHEWLKSQNDHPIGIRIGRTGSIIIYKFQTRTFSLGGPCELQFFAPKLIKNDEYDEYDDATLQAEIVSPK